MIEEKQLQRVALRQLEFESLLNFITKYALSDSAKEIILNLEPTEDLQFLNEEYKLIEQIVSILVADDEIPYEGVDDVRAKLHKSLVTNAVLTSGEILKLRELMHQSRSLKAYFSLRDDRYPFVYNRVERLFENKLLEKHISDAIDENGEIKDSASRELSRIRREIIEKSHRLRSRLEKILSSVAKDDMVTEEFISVRDGRFVIPIKAEHKRHVPGIIHNVSQTGSTVFLEPSETFEMNNEISMLMSEEKREIYKILKNLTEEIGQDAGQLLMSYDIIVHLDSIMARAKYALDFGGIKPTISDDNEIYLKDVRHPLLCHGKGINNVIPLSSEFNDKKRGQLISGPNAGGKTVALKSIGINVAMALSGIFPLGICKTNFRMIFSSIGDNQSIEHDLSTFSSQIIQIRNIVECCTAQSLVLVDEICSGTDPYEGSALAAGILDTFIALNAFFIVTTHQSSLKTYSLNREVIENASLEFDDKKLKPTYKYLSGIPGNSYAFALAKSLGLNKLVLERADKFLGGGHSELEKSIALLQEYKQEAEQLKLIAAQEKMKAEKLRIEYENKLKEIKIKKKELIDSAHKEALDVLNSANALIEKTVREIREEQKAVADVKKEFQIQRENLEIKVNKSDNKNSIASEPDKLTEGDVVALEDSDSIGTVIFIDDNGKMALVDFNGVKFRMPANQLKKTKKKDKLKKEYSNYLKFDAQTRLDLRGKRAEASIREIDDMINDALVSNVNILTIIHGKGTGALRHAVHQYLSGHPSVIKFRLGDLTEGGDGVTIVEL
jgi:DNA mismatch repair protein MutS2